MVRNMSWRAGRKVSKEHVVEKREGTWSRTCHGKQVVVVVRNIPWRAERNMVRNMSWRSDHQGGAGRRHGQEHVMESMGSGIQEHILESREDLWSGKGIKNQGRMVAGHMS